MIYATVLGQHKLNQLSLDHSKNQILLTGFQKILFCCELTCYLPHKYKPFLKRERRIRATALGQYPVFNDKGVNDVGKKDNVVGKKDNVVGSNVLVHWGLCWKSIW